MCHRLGEHTTGEHTSRGGHQDAGLGLNQVQTYILIHITCFMGLQFSVGFGSIINAQSNTKLSIWDYLGSFNPQIMLNTVISMWVWLKRMFGAYSSGTSCLKHIFKLIFNILIEKRSSIPMQGYILNHFRVICTCSLRN